MCAKQQTITFRKIVPIVTKKVQNLYLLHSFVRTTLTIDSKPTIQSKDIMAVIGDNEEVTTEIPLSPQPEVPPATAQQQEQAAFAQAANVPTDEERVIIDDGDEEVDELLDELEEPTEAELAVRKLRQSTNKLTNALKSVGSDIDSKFRVREQVRSVDSQLGVSQTAQTAASKLGGLWSQLQISEKTQALMNQDSVKDMSYSISNTIEKTGIIDAAKRGRTEVQNLDQEHHISSKAAGVLGSGIDWFATTLQKTSSGDGGQGER